MPANTAPYYHKNVGEDLNRLSCLSALLRIEVNDQVHRVAQKGLGYHAASHLPFRWLSCEYSPTDGIIGRVRSLKSSNCDHVADGTCAIDIVFARDFEDAVSGLELYNAAEALFEKCVIGNISPIGEQLIKVGKSEFPEKKI